MGVKVVTAVGSPHRLISWHGMEMDAVSPAKASPQKQQTHRSAQLQFSNSLYKHFAAKV